MDLRVGCSALWLGLALLGCDVQVDTSDLDPKLRPKSGSTIQRTIAHPDCSGSDIRLEYENADGEAIAQCFGLKEDTQICSLATCESGGEVSEETKRRQRKQDKQLQDAAKAKRKAQSGGK